MTGEAIVNQSLGYIMYCSSRQGRYGYHSPSTYVCFHCHIYITFSFEGSSGASYVLQLFVCHHMCIVHAYSLISLIES